MLLILSVIACSGNNTGFSSNPDEVDGPAGDAAVVIRPLELVWTDLDVGYSYSQDLTLESTGTGDLIVYDIRIVADALDAFFVDEIEDLVMPSGDVQSFPVVADLEVAKPASGTLRIRTNDVNAIEVLVPLNAYPAGYAPPEDTGGDSGS